MGVFDVRKHILNQGREEEQVVDAPAFSLTKVLASGAVIIAPLATLLTDFLADAELASVHYVALALGLLGFLAVTAAADVLARGIATGASKHADVAKRNAEAAAERAAAQEKVADAQFARLMRFETPLAARRIKVGPDAPIKLLALAQGRTPYYLAQEGDEVMWLGESEVKIA